MTRILVFAALTFVHAVSFAATDESASGNCSLQPTFVGCHVCCEIDARLGDVLSPACGSSIVVAGGLVGGVIGSGIGRFIGNMMCDVMMHDTHCEDRCVGKDGDPDPIGCLDPSDPETGGVCRQVCEQGQHDMGPGTCPTGWPLDLRCCANEYDPPDEVPCPDSLCPGPACPPGCAVSF